MKTTSIAALLMCSLAALAAADDTQRWKDTEARLSEAIAASPKSDDLYSRRGDVRFFLSDFNSAAADSFDNVDRENGIWRYLCQYKAFGVEKAREGLLKYEKDDREPFGDVYRLFQGTMTAEELLSKIRTAQISESEREKRMFYAELYVGLNEAVEGRDASACEHLEAAAKNTWPQQSGYGPHYMNQVARLHAELLAKKGARSKAK
jgi:lipoprotein NlpI